MRRKGISFTLTIVVAGVILLMTALSVITLGGSSISDFFGTAGEQQTSALVRQACQDKAGQIQSDYCSQYVMTGYVTHDEGPDCQNSEADAPDSEEDCDGDDTPDQATDDTYTYSRVSPPDCDTATNNRRVPPQDTSDQTRLYQDEDSLANDGNYAHYFEQTASQAGCEWEGNAQSFAGGEIDPRVEVRGNTYNCLQEGYLSPTCPVQ